MSAARLCVALFALLFAILAPIAAASRAMPQPLERQLHSALAVVIVSVAEPPEHPGDVYEATVERSLRGDLKPDATLRVSAYETYHGLRPPGGAARQQPSWEKGATRLLLILHRRADDVWFGDEPIRLLTGSTAAAWFYHRHDATRAPAAVESLLALGGEEDLAAAATRWADGLRSGNPLLQAALLHRISFAAGESEWALGKELAATAARQLDAARPAVLPLAADLAQQSDDPALRHLAFDALRSCLPARSAAEHKAVAVALEAAVRSAGSDEGHERTEALRLLTDVGDSRAPQVLHEAFRAEPGRDHPDLSGLNSILADLVRRHDTLGRELVGRLIADLDHDDHRAAALAALPKVTGHEGPATPEEWRVWFREG